MNDTNLRFGLLDDGATWAASNRADSLFDRFFALFDESFVLEDEKETAEGFSKVLSLNHGPEHARWAARFGPFQEWVVVVSNAQGSDIAAANFLACLLPGNSDLPARVSIQLNYVCIHPSQRGRGLLRQVLNVVREVGSHQWPHAGAPLVFVEMNDPMKMPVDKLAQDAQASGMDPVDRLSIWNRMGMRVVDFHYIQPALGAGQRDEDGLALGLLDPAPCLHSVYLGQHLERFFSISVMKGLDIHYNHCANTQVGICLAADRPLRTFNLDGCLEELRRDVGMRMRGETHGRIELRRWLAGKLLLQCRDE